MLHIFLGAHKMTSQNLQNYVATTPVSINGATTMLNSESPTQSPTPAESICELEYAVRLGFGPRHMYDLRQAGKLPPHFLATKPGSAKKQVRYLISAIEAHERTKQKTEPQK
jgi:hypothetical protein